MVRLLNVYYPTRTVVLLLLEAAIVGGCFIAAAMVVLGVDDALIALNYEDGWPKVGLISCMSIMLSYYFDLYEPQILSARDDLSSRLLFVLGFDCIIVSLLLYCFPDFALGERGSVYALGFALLTPALILWRRAYDWIVSQSFFRERVFVLGADEYAKSVVEAIRTRPEIGMEVVDWREVEGEPAERKKVWIQTLAGLSRHKVPVTRIIVAMKAQRGELPVEELLALRFRGVKVEEAGSLTEKLSGTIPLDGLRPAALLYAEGFRLRKSHQFLRQIVSMLVATIGLVIFLPLFPFVVLAVRLSSKGPIFFSQVRVGQGGRPFKVYKFRTMFVDAEAGGAKWATKNDPRISKVGMIMRKTRLDEVPQLWNILRGDMGFVGPRPERPEFVPMLAEAIPFFHLRHLVRPGLTGWAQIRYGYGSTMEEARRKLEYDLYYIKHMSLSFDLLIMFETIKTVVRRRGAQ